MAFQVLFLAKAERQLADLPSPIRRCVQAAIDGLSENPRPSGVKKLRKSENLYRVRVGAYRVIYLIKDEAVIVVVVSIGHRREVYEKLLKKYPRDKILEIISDDT